MKPGGPTERVVDTALWERDNRAALKQSVFTLAHGVGEDAPNRPDDVRGMKHALALAGYESESGAPSDAADSEFFGNIRLFKREYNLPGGNAIAPGDGAMIMLERIVRPLMLERDAVRSAQGNTPPPRIELAEATVIDDSDIDPKPTSDAIDIVEKTLRKFQGFVRGGRKLDYNFSADMLARYLSRKGGTEHIPPERILQFKPVRDALAFNRARFNKDILRGRFKNDITKKSSSVLYRNLAALKDGEEVVVFPDPRLDEQEGSDTERSGEPVWDREIEGILGSDFYFATGKSNLHSEGIFRAKRIGDKIIIEGVITHEYRDTYDFDDETFLEIPDLGDFVGSDAKLLEKNGKAKPFDIRSRWTEKVTVTIDIEKGLFKNPRIKWSGVK